ncbi:hypothetical protein C8F01DRAFT_1105391 [Mycena amicta]|nr:hypothetical protein C8F01DRAFT_1105391 [Mycena amicta]
MPYISDTDVAWPRNFVIFFDAARFSTTNNRYLGAYNALLSYCFCEDFNFVVSCETVDSMVYLVVFDVAQQSPVFFVQVNDELSPTERIAADEKMRKRYKDRLRGCVIPRLYGLSVLGSRMRVYCNDKTVDPSDEALPRFNLPDHCLEVQWGVDILSPRGFSEMKKMITFIKDESAQIRPQSVNLDVRGARRVKQKGRSSFNLVLACLLFGLVLGIAGLHLFLSN